MNHNSPTINPISSYHHHYEQNTIGRDFVVGDLQGVYDELMDSLKQLKFDYHNDRLFCVGDLIDRGPKSFECANLIYEPWFHTTLGNHELMMMQSIIKHDESYHDLWINNGGLWHKCEDSQLLVDLAISFSNLPLIISIGNGENRFNIVHAEILMMDMMSNKYIPVTDRDIDNWNFHKFTTHDMLWGRHLVDIRTSKYGYKLMDIEAKQRLQSASDMSITFCGHSIVPNKPVRIEQQIYLDTGMCNYHKPNNEKWKHTCTLTLACPTNQTIYTYQLPWRKLTSMPFSNMRTYS